MWKIFEAASANALWEQAINRLTSGDEYDVRVSRAGVTREILHVAMSISNPRDRWVTCRQPPINVAFALAEVIWILSGRNDSSFLAYFNRSLSRFVGDSVTQHGAYGARLRKHFGIDQLEMAYQTLRSDSNSRQVVLQIWDATRDLPFQDGLPRNQDIPCNTQSILKIRENRLEWLQIMRSNDVFLGLPYNIVQFTFIQEILAGWLGIELGSYHHISDSLHVYCSDLSSVSVKASDKTESIDNFSLNKSESDATISELTFYIDLISNDNVSADDLLKLVNEATLPVSYMDILKVLAAEGLRRRRRVDGSDTLMRSCRSEAFRRMWQAWIIRVSSKF